MSISASPAATPPEIVQPLKNVMALQNKSVTMQCVITGSPKPKITWYKGNREIFNGNKYYMDKDGDTYFLDIRDVYGEDADDYSCRAHNAGGHKSTRATLTIKSESALGADRRHFENLVVKPIPIANAIHQSLLFFNS